MAAMVADPYLWLEDIDGDNALGWVRERNDTCVAEFGRSEFERLRTEALPRHRHPHPLRTASRGPPVQLLARRHPAGQARRTAGALPVRCHGLGGDIDLDELARSDGENWVWAGADVIEPDHTLALISLVPRRLGRRRGARVRHADKVFRSRRVHPSEAKSRVSREDHDTLLVGILDFGPGSLTDSGYPRIAGRRRRGQPLAEAQTLFTGADSDVIVAAGVDSNPWLRTNVDQPGGRLLQRRDLPTATRPVGGRGRTGSHRRPHRRERVDPSGLVADRALLGLAHRACGLSGRVAAGHRLRNLDGGAESAAELAVVFEPDDHTCLHQYAWTRERLVMVTSPTSPAGSRSSRRAHGHGSRCGDPEIGGDDNLLLRVHTDEHRHRRRRRHR